MVPLIMKGNPIMGCHANTQVSFLGKYITKKTFVVLVAICDPFNIDS